MKFNKIFLSILIILGLAYIFNNVNINAKVNKKITVIADRVKMRSKPSTDGEIIRTLYSLDEFHEAVPVGKPQKIGKYNNRWYKVSIHDLHRYDPCNVKITKGYVYGAFLDTPQKAEKKFKKIMLSNITLEKKLMYKNLFFGDIRMKPGGKSDERINEHDVYAAQEYYTTKYFKWKKIKNYISFNVLYDYVSRYEGAKDYIEKEKWTASCTVTGVKKKGDKFQILVKEKDPHCSYEISGKSNKIGRTTNEPCY